MCSDKKPAFFANYHYCNKFNNFYNNDSCITCLQKGCLDVHKKIRKLKGVEQSTSVMNVSQLVNLTLSFPGLWD